MGRLLVLILALVVYGSLYPWQFVRTPSGDNPLWVVATTWRLQFSKAIIGDAILNIFLYLPIGFTAFVTFARRMTDGKNAALLAFLLGTLRR